MVHFNLGELLDPTFVREQLRKLIDNMLAERRMRDLAHDLDDNEPFLDDPDYDWDRATAAEAWEELDIESKADIINWYDDLNAMGQLGDVPFYEQWIALRRKPV